MTTQFDGWSIPDMVTWAQSHVEVRFGTPASVDEIAQIERGYGIILPPDHREVLTRWGGLEVVCEGWTLLRVYDVASMAAARTRFRGHFARWGVAGSWPDGAHEELAMLKPAYQSWVPVMIQHEDEDHRATVCLAADGTAYTVSVKEMDVEKPWESFTAAFAVWLDGATDDLDLET